MAATITANRLTGTTERWYAAPFSIMTKGTGADRQTLSTPLVIVVRELRVLIYPISEQAAIAICTIQIPDILQLEMHSWLRLKKATPCMVLITSTATKTWLTI